MNLALRAALVPLLLAATATAAGAFDYRSLHLLEDRHTHAIIRVSEAPENGDRPERGRADCNDVRALDRRGRNVAVAFGRMFQRSGIHIDDIMTSSVCRNIEAAKLLQIGPVTITPLLDPLAAGDYAPDRVDRLLGEIDSMRPAETVLLITHAANIEALTGETLRPGEGLVFRLPPFGELEVRAHFELPPL